MGLAEHQRPRRNSRQGDRDFRPVLINGNVYQGGADNIYGDLRQRGNDQAHQQHQHNQLRRPSFPRGVGRLGNEFSFQHPLPWVDRSANQPLIDTGLISPGRRRSLMPSVHHQRPNVPAADPFNQYRIGDVHVNYHGPAADIFNHRPGNDPFNRHRAGDDPFNHPGDPPVPPMHHRHQSYSRANPPDPHRLARISALITSATRQGYAGLISGERTHTQIWLIHRSQRHIYEAFQQLDDPSDWQALEIETLRSTNDGRYYCVRVVDRHGAWRESLRFMAAALDRNLVQRYRHEIQGRDDYFLG